MVTLAVAAVDRSGHGLKANERASRLMVDFNDVSDEELFAAISAGESAALGALFDRYSRLAIAVAYRVLADHALAEDVVQEAFLTVWRRAATFDASRGAVKSWLLTIVRNAAVDRRRGRHARALQDTPLDDLAFKLATDEEETFTIVATTVEAERVRAALNELPAEQREAIELAYFGGLTQQEIAERTGAPLGTIKGRMRLGLQKLRGNLADLLPPEDQAPSSDAPSSGPNSDARVRERRSTEQPGLLARWGWRLSPA